MRKNQGGELFIVKLSVEGNLRLLGERLVTHNALNKKESAIDYSVSRINIKYCGLRVASILPKH